MQWSAARLGKSSIFASVFCISLIAAVPSSAGQAGLGAAKSIAPAGQAGLGKVVSASGQAGLGAAKSIAPAGQAGLGKAVSASGQTGLGARKSSVGRCEIEPSLLDLSCEPN